MNANRWDGFEYKMLIRKDLLHKTLIDISIKSTGLMLPVAIPREFLYLQLHSRNIRGQVVNECKFGV